MPAVTVTISLDSDDHAHILRWLGRQENVSAAGRDVWSAHVLAQVTLVDVHREVLSLREEVVALRAHGGYVEMEGEGSEADNDVAESVEVASVLDKLGVD